MKSRSSHAVLLAFLTYTLTFWVELKRFFKPATDCDIDGVIIPDLSVEESEEYKRLAED